MNKSILVLDENSVIHGLITSALEAEGLTLHHEFNPGKYVERANSLMPDLILIGNSERDPEYGICHSLRASGALSEVPMVLLAASKEALTRDQIAQLRVDGVVRKPFEASDLQQQVSKHLNLVDLIGSAYEYRQSQSSFEEGPNPLANLDVVDEEVLALLRGGALPAGAVAGWPRPTGAPVVDDAVLAETLQPERAFEPVEAGAPAAAARFDSLETLEGDFPSEDLGMPESEFQLDELGAADVLEEETPEEAVFEPQGFDQELGESADAARAGDTLDDIELELPEEPEALGALEDDGTVDLFESDLAEEPGTAGAAEFEESIPLSVRRMMELKPVLTMTQEETAEEEELFEPMEFAPEEGEVEAIQQELEELEEVELGVSAEERELEFASEEEVRALEDELEPPEPFDLGVEPAPEPRAAAAEPEPEVLALDDEERDAGEIGADVAEELADRASPETRGPMQAVVGEAPEGEDEDYFVEEYLGDEEIDEEQIIAAGIGDDAEEAFDLTEEDEAELSDLLSEEEHLADLDDLDDLDASGLVAEDAQGLGDDEIELDQEEEDVILASLDSEQDEAAAAEGTAGEPLFERNFNALEEEGAAPEAESEAWKLEPEDGGFSLADEEEPDEETAKVITLSAAEQEPRESALEEVPDSALEEIDEFEELELMEAIDAGDEAPPAEPAVQDEGPVVIEFGEGEPGVFAETGEAEAAWKPKAPPSFVPTPAEDFPEDAVGGPFVGPHGVADLPEPPQAPRHEPVEVLEDPDSLTPVASDEEMERESTAGDLVDEVQPEDLTWETDAELTEHEEEFAASPSLSVLADDALGSVESAGQVGDTEPVDEGTLDIELGEEPLEEAWEETEMADAFEPMEDEGGTADVTRAELDTLLEDETGTLDQDAEEPADGEDLEAMLGTGHEAAEPEASATRTGADDPEFDNLFSSLREEIAANPEGERLDDVLRIERIRDRIAALDFSLPQHENTFARAMGIYELPGDGEGPSAYADARVSAEAPPEQPAAKAPAPQVAAGAVARVVADVGALSLLDEDIRAKLGQVLDEIISISVRKAVQEEMPKIMERLSKDA